VADIADAYVRVTLVPRAQFGQRAGTFSDGGDPRRARVSDKKIGNDLFQLSTVFLPISAS